MSVYQKEHPEFLKESIESMLNQTIRTNDFVIVCDGKLTKELDYVLNYYLTSYGNLFQIIRLKQNVGLGEALNIGMSYCKNELIARMDSDDISLPDRCEKQLNIFKNMQVDIVGGAVNEFETSLENVEAKRTTPQTSEEIYQYSKKRNPFNHPSVMFRKEAVSAAGSYQPFPYFEDYYLWVRMLNHNYKGYNIPETILYMRTGHEFFERRGGIPYIKYLWKFKRKLREMKYTTKAEFLVSTFPRVIVSLMPNKIRILFYKKLLRK